jgi:hypothetical protein
LPLHAAFFRRRFSRHRFEHRHETFAARRSNRSIADGDFNVNGPFSDDPKTTRDGSFWQQAIPTGLWRTKGLRQIAGTAPYFRDGQAATLDDVINFYDRGGDPPGTFLGGPKEIRPLNLSAEEKEWLKEFLTTLTGEPVPAQFLQDLHNP